MAGYALMQLVTFFGLVALSNCRSSIQNPLIYAIGENPKCVTKQLDTVQDNNKQAKKVRSETPAGKTGLQHPSEFFRNQVDKYSAFDDKGIPTHDLNGNELSKSQLKKLKKVYDAQVKRHEAFVKSKSVTDKER
ncbi:cysteinyl-tRNA synthetase [Clonorchis sinensis]|uniref:Cysteinyl-tRNA synthetase n=1 Tax=Clonorchis sinensis TaxID=79923 RepID=G7YTF2_CLOSI|nr:cysteinyl-tRNA synthetase [Clonorchis sinensis]